MWEPLIKICNNFVNKDIIEDDLKSFNNLKINFASELKKISFDKKIIPFGRYLLADEEEFNIQMDVFSNNYIGSIHSHGTWGMFGMISGGLIVDDWAKYGNEFSFIRSSLLLSGCISTFTKLQDWHKVSTLDLTDQTISIHLYGSNYDLDKGLKLDENLHPVEYTRSKFGDFDSIKSHFKYNS